MRRWRWWVAERDRWYHTWRDEMSAANRARQGEPIESMTDTELLEHLARAGDHLVKGVILHFRLIPVCDLPVGRLLVACDGLDRPRHRHWREVVHRTACVASDPEDALARLEPDDVLVTTHTTPAYEAILPIVGAVVTDHGGLTSHAALVSRELGLPAVLGVIGATTTIPNGARVTVDPVAGTVTII